MTAEAATALCRVRAHEADRRGDASRGNVRFGGHLGAR